MNESLTLLEIAFEDLDASRTLLKNYHYPQALFYFQQAVEKATKSLGLHAGVFSKEQLHRKIGHETLKVFKEVIRQTTPPAIPGYSYDDSFDIDKTYQSIMSFAKNHEIELLLPVYINHIEEYKKAGQSSVVEIPEIKTKGQFLELVKALNIELKDLPEIEKLPEEHDFFKEQFRKINEKILATPKYVEKLLILYVLGLIVVELVSDVRYPNSEEFERPSNVYDHNHVLVKNLDYFQEELYQCIKAILKSFS
jgi:hypothetical protein